MLLESKSLGIAFCRQPRVICQKLFQLAICFHICIYTFQAPIIRCLRSKGGKTWNLYWSVTAFPSSLFVVAIHFFLSLALSFSLASSRAFSIVSRGVSRDIIPTGSLFPFPLLPLFTFSHPLLLSTYKRFDWNRSASREARKQASKAFQMKVSPVISFSATRIASSLPLSSAFFFAFFCTFKSLS